MMARLTFTSADRVNVRAGLGVTVATVALLAAVGCGSAPAGPTDTAAASISTADLLPVPLPDVSGMDASVQTQLTDAHATLSAAESEAPAGADRRAAAYGRLGTLLLAGEQLDTAEPALVNAHRLSPGERRWSYYLGHLYQEKGNLSEAATWFEKALELKPTDFPTLIWLTSAYIDMGQPETAAPLLERARSLRPDTSVVRFQLGRAAVATRDYSVAIEHLETALALSPGATIIHYPLGMAYRGAGDLDAAERHLNLSGGRASGSFVAGVMMGLSDPLMAEVTTALRSPQLYRDLALQADANRDYREAARLFREAVTLTPSDPVMQLSLGMALDRAGDAAGAVEALQDAIGLDPELAQAHYTLGTLLERGGRDRDAIDRFRDAVSHGADSVETVLRLADALRRTDQVDESVAYYRQVLAALDPRNAGGEPSPATASADGTTQSADEAARFGEAMALVQLGRHQEARERMIAALDRYPGHLVFANGLARLLAASPDGDVRDGPRAFDLVQRVVELHKTTAVAETMAMALAEVGQFAGAIEWQQMAIEVARESGRRDIAQQMSANLAVYQRREPVRVPWRDDEPEHRPGPPVDPNLLP